MITAELHRIFFFRPLKTEFCLAHGVVWPNWTGSSLFPWNWISPFIIWSINENNWNLFFFLFKVIHTCIYCSNVIDDFICLIWNCYNQLKISFYFFEKKILISRVQRSESSSIVKPTTQEFEEKNLKENKNIFSVRMSWFCLLPITSRLVLLRIQFSLRKKKYNESYKLVIIDYIYLWNQKNNLTSMTRRKEEKKLDKNQTFNDGQLRRVWPISLQRPHLRCLLSPSLSEFRRLRTWVDWLFRLPPPAVWL